jgi:hypothetical protein
VRGPGVVGEELGRTFDDVVAVVSFAMVLSALRGRARRD